MMKKVRLINAALAAVLLTSFAAHAQWLTKVDDDLFTGVKWFTEFGHLNRGDMLTSEQHRCHNEKKKFQRRV